MNPSTETILTADGQFHPLAGVLVAVILVAGTMLCVCRSRKPVRAPKPDPAEAISLPTHVGPPVDIITREELQEVLVIAIDHLGTSLERAMAPKDEPRASDMDEFYVTESGARLHAHADCSRIQAHHSDCTVLRIPEDVNIWLTKTEANVYCKTCCETTKQ